MHAELRRLHSPDIENLENFAPKEEDNFGFLLQMMVGPSDSASEESFDIQVCTPGWLARRYKSVGIVPLRHHLLVFGYDYSLLVTTLRKLLDSCRGTRGRKLQ